MADPMTAALTPDTALERLGELVRGVHEAVVLDGAGKLLAGRGELAEPAAALVKAIDAAAVEVADDRGSVFAVRDRDHAIVAVVDHPALPALMLYDLRILLDGLSAPRAA
jgi:hypothetical protein